MFNLITSLSICKVEMVGDYNPSTKKKKFNAEEHGNDIYPGKLRQSVEIINTIESQSSEYFRTQTQIQSLLGSTAEHKGIREMEWVTLCPHISCLYDIAIA